jgi:hypothetical protein
MSELGEQNAHPVEWPHFVDMDRQVFGLEIVLAHSDAIGLGLEADTLDRQVDTRPMVSRRDLPTQATEETTEQAMAGAGPLVREDVVAGRNYNLQQASKRQEANEQRLRNVRADLKNLDNSKRRFFDEYFGRFVLSSPFLNNQFEESGSFSVTEWMSLAPEEVLINALQYYIHSIRTQQPPILNDKGQITDVYTPAKPEAPVIPPQPLNLGPPSPTPIVVKLHPPKRVSA